MRVPRTFNRRDDRTHAIEISLLLAKGVRPSHAEAMTKRTSSSGLADIRGMLCPRANRQAVPCVDHGDGDRQSRKLCLGEMAANPLEVCIRGVGLGDASQ